MCESPENTEENSPLLHQVVQRTVTALAQRDEFRGIDQGQLRDLLLGAASPQEVQALIQQVPDGADED